MSSDKMGTCLNCARERKIRAKGLCTGCYQRQLYGISPKFSSKPILDYAAERGISLVGNGVQLDATITTKRADELACKFFGVHPCVIYGDEWFSAA